MDTSHIIPFSLSDEHYQIRMNHYKQWQTANKQQDEAYADGFGITRKRSRGPILDDNGCEEGSLQKRSIDAGIDINILFPGMASIETTETTIPTSKSAQDISIPAKILTSTINMFMVAQDEMSIWGKFAPIVPLGTEEPPICVWVTQQYLPAVAQRMPPMGVPTLVSQIRRGGKVALSRYAISAAMTEDSLRYKNGVAQWLQTINQMAGSMVSATQLGVAHLIANGDAFIRDLERAMQLQPATIDEEFDNLARSFAKLQLPGPIHFSELYDEMGRQYIERGNDPTLPRWVVISERTYNTLIHTNDPLISWTSLGPEGAALLQRQGTLGEVNHLGIPLFILRSFNLGDGFVDQPTNRFLEFGEYAHSYITPTRKSGQNRAFEVLLGNSWTEFTLDDVIDHCVKWNDPSEANPNADVEPLDGPKFQGKWSDHAFGTINGTLAKTLGETSWWSSYSLNNIWSTDIAEKLKGTIVNGVLLEQLTIAEVINICAKWTITKKNLKMLANAFPLFPFNVLVAWPHIRVLADDAILTTPGTYVRMVKPNIVSVGHNQLSRVHEIVAEFEFAAAIIRSENIIPARAVRLTYYLGGLEKQWIDPDDGGYNPSTFMYNGDCMAIILPPTFTKVPRNLNLAGSISGKLLGRFSTSTDATGEDPNTYAGYQYYETYFGFSTRKVNAHVRGERFHPNAPEHSSNMDAPTNCICRPMVQRLWDEKAMAYSMIDGGDGYWKMGTAYSGCRAARFGGSFVKHSPENDLKPV